MKKWMKSGSNKRMPREDSEVIGMNINVGKSSFCYFCKPTNFCKYCIFRDLHGQKNNANISSSLI